MISPSDHAYITKHAYVPEHLPNYVSAISGTEPFLIGDFVIHLRAPYLVFVGYPLQEDWNETQMVGALNKTKSRFNPQVVSVIAPMLPSVFEDVASSHLDEYYRLDLDQLVIPKKTRNMLRRAQREVSICSGVFDREHKKLIRAFLRGSRFDKATQFIFKRVPEYVKSKSVEIYDARNARGELVAFDVAEFGTQGYAFYMFNFRSSKHHIPGVSDLLLAHIIEHAKAEGKSYLNLGLGIDPGIAFFKKKWGAISFLKHTTFVLENAQQAPLWESYDEMLR
jgi:hypothetical protein